MLFVPPSMPFMVPEAEAETHTTPPLTVPADMTVTTSSGSSGTLTNSTGTFQLVTFSVTAADEGIGCRWDNWAGQASDYGSALLEISRYFSVGPHTVTCSGGGSSQSFTITIIEETPVSAPPVVTMPADLVVEFYTEGGSGAHVQFNVTAYDTDGIRSINCSWDNGAGQAATANVFVASGQSSPLLEIGRYFSVGTHTVTCFAVDLTFTNSVESSFTITVTSPADTTPPVPYHQGDITLSTTDNSGTTATFSVQAYDSSGISSGPTCSPADGSQFPVGTTTVTCTATDNAGNTGSASFTVTIVYTPLVAGPIITSLEVYADPTITTRDQMRFHVTGICSSVPCGTDLAFGAINPSGILAFHKILVNSVATSQSVDGTTTCCFGETFDRYPFLNLDTALTSDLVAGTWTMRVCAVPPFSALNENADCANQNFTIAESYDTTSPEHIALEQFMDDFITVTAVNNSTSPTGRTLTVINDRISSDQFGTLLGSDSFPDMLVNFKIKKGGTTVFDLTEGGDANHYRADYWSSHATWNTHSWSIPIPEDWTGGTYTIIWDWAWTDIDIDTLGWGGPDEVWNRGNWIVINGHWVVNPAVPVLFSGSDSSTFTVPAPPASGDTTPPVITFYARACQTTLYGLLQEGNCGAGTFWDNDTSISTDPNNMYLNLLPNPATLNLSTTNSTGIAVIQYVTAFAVVDGVPLEGLLHHSCTSTGGWFPVGTTVITCTATDAAGNTGSASMTVTVTLEGAAETEMPYLTATAYVNATSPTGRTLNAIAVDLPTGCEPWPDCIQAGDRLALTSTISKDGIQVTPMTTFLDYHPEPSYVTTTWQIPIPEDWESGTYDINWYVTGLFPFYNLESICLDADGDFSNTNLCIISTSSISVTIPALTSGTTPPEEEIVIPSWIKNNAGWWADGLIDDRAFVSGLQWLISNGIMNIPPTEQGVGSDDVIPGWIKNNAGWWADDLIDDRNFVTGLQWLITNGIMVIG